MGTLVRQWVLNKLGLPIPEYSDPIQLRKGLSNGYIFAEILRKYSIISDDQLIALGHNFTEKTKLRNMKYVHRWMTGAGFLFNFSEFLDVAEEKPGAVVNFLYKLYFLLEGSESRGIKTSESTQASDFLLSTPKDLELPDPDLGGIHSESILEARSRIQAATVEREQKLLFISTEKVLGEVSEEETESEGLLPLPHCIIVDSKAADLDEEYGKIVLECPVPQIQLPSKGDTLEATKVYFMHQAGAKVKLDLKKEDSIKKKWNAEKRVHHWESVDGSGKTAFDNLKTIDFGGSEEQRQFEKIRAKLEAEYKLAKEMEQFDSSLLEPSEDEDIQEDFENLKKTSPAKMEPVYFNPIEWQIKINRLKCERKQERENSQHRILLRKALSDKLIKTIPTQIHEDLVQTTLEKTRTISLRETELSEFLLNSHHRSKSIFMEHLTLEENLLQEIQISRENQLATQREREKELKHICESLTHKRGHRIDDEKSENEMALLLMIIKHQLNTMLRLVFRIADFRSLTGSEPSEEQIQEWKSWLQLGLETPQESEPEEDEDNDGKADYDLMDGNCHILLGDDPIPIELSHAGTNSPHNPKDIKNMFATNVKGDGKK